MPREHVFWCGGAELHGVPEPHAVGGRREQLGERVRVCSGLHRSWRTGDVYGVRRRHVQVDKRDRGVRVLRSRQFQ